jgi:tetratricopeptide (TPR) repeat protein
MNTGGQSTTFVTKSLVDCNLFFIVFLIRWQRKDPYMFCGKCGYQAIDVDNFCTMCGKPLRKNLGAILDRIGFREAELNESRSMKDPVHLHSVATPPVSDFEKNMQKINDFKSQPDSKKISQEFYRKGLAVAEEGMFLDALDSFDRVLKIQPDNIEAMYAKACLVQMRGESDDAVDLLNKVVTVKPEYKKSIINNQVFRKLKHDPRFEKLVH